MHQGDGGDSTRFSSSVVGGTPEGPAARRPRVLAPWRPGLSVRVLWAWTGARCPFAV